MKTSEYFGGKDFLNIPLSDDGYYHKNNTNCKEWIKQMMEIKDKV